MTTLTRRSIEVLVVALSAFTFLGFGHSAQQQPDPGCVNCHPSGICLDPEDESGSPGLEPGAFPMWSNVPQLQWEPLASQPGKWELVHTQQVGREISFRNCKGQKVTFWQWTHVVKRRRGLVFCESTGTLNLPVTIAEANFGVQNPIELGPPILPPLPPKIHHWTCGWNCGSDALGLGPGGGGLPGSVFPPPPPEFPDPPPLAPGETVTVDDAPGGTLWVNPTDVVLLLSGSASYLPGIPGWEAAPLGAIVVLFCADSTSPESLGNAQPIHVASSNGDGTFASKAGTDSRVASTSFEGAFGQYMQDGRIYFTMCWAPLP